jgi:hypothetical protein
MEILLWPLRLVQIQMAQSEAFLWLVESFKGAQLMDGGILLVQVMRLEITVQPLV